jgi:hypothetical protein
MSQITDAINQLALRTDLDTLIREKTHKVMADYCITSYQKLIKVVNANGPAFFYNDSTCLWEEMSIKQLGQKMTYFVGLELAMKKVTQKLSPGLQKEVAKLQQVIDTSGFSNSSAEWLAGKLCNKEDGKLFDNASGFLPLKGRKVIDLSTKQVFERKIEHYFTYEIPVDYNTENTSPVFQDFISSIMLEDKGKIGEKSRFLQKFLGYTISGSTHERLVGIFIGDGFN